MKNRKHIPEFFKFLQDEICEGLEKLDGTSQFTEDQWKRDGGGGGRTRVIEEGAVFEKGGVNFSEVFGDAPSQIIHTLELDGGEIENAQFYAAGLSIVIHPKSPMVPIIHMNIRYFELTDSDGQQISEWFGGGIDLTPHYVVDKDARFFHENLKSACDRFDANYYDKFKLWADEYFFNTHRQESRGIGGIFFDRMVNDNSHTMEQHFEFVQAVGKSFLPIYGELVLRNKDLPFGKREEEWQAFRRGRYVEFNLIYDRGTKFGLQTGGRTESILMSLPKTASWKYKFKPDKGSKEDLALKKLVKGIAWVE
ncbi:MAG TPA: oxygen-dependent coproporphyrinogen oxidase [Flavobacteriales bacterium]|nr:oxygen-dependent coproporphyrinogen oxidase [Flavobacteriales bacterium]HIN40779.1 oxygen-dependent coproporphyrinogen oxidase [Flavobacteriales bacterium]